jgi:6-phosphogluconate dehydrogenase
MVHNGIEYGDMQLISEAYHLMLSGLGLGYEEMANVSFITNGEKFFGKRFKLKML